MTSPELRSYEDVMHSLAVTEAKLYVTNKRLQGLIIICFGLLFNFLLALGVVCHLYCKLHKLV